MSFPFKGASYIAWPGTGACCRENDQSCVEIWRLGFLTGISKDMMKNLIEKPFIIYLI